VSDERLRELERRVGVGDSDARAPLFQARARAGKCPWCAGAGAVHAFELTDETLSREERDYEANCCCAGCFKLYGIPNGGMCTECPAGRR
jgi:hypothetical protein